MAKQTFLIQSIVPTTSEFDTLIMARFHENANDFILTIKSRVLGNIKNVMRRRSKSSVKSVDEKPDRYAW